MRKGGRLSSLIEFHRSVALSRFYALIDHPSLGPVAGRVVHAVAGASDMVAASVVQTASDLGLVDTSASTT
ncbi:hypothetical protein AA103196_1373 [Ameyamaea chiangmaiensis NBRC 103196]|nr:hypothetical protein AA103196_1373 [Ameyamaea chiangmaiensis NBRC 103196]